MFKLKRPCKTCPFRIGQGSKFGLGRARLREIFAGAAFQCHGTIDYSGETGAKFDHDPGEDAPSAGDHPQQCAGLMAVLLRDHRPNQIMRLAMRLGYLKRAEIDPGKEAYASVRQAVRAHLGKEPG